MTARTVRGFAHSEYICMIYGYVSWNDDDTMMLCYISNKVLMVNMADDAIVYQMLKCFE